MEAIQESIQALSVHFNKQMEEFQKSLQGAIPATSPNSNITGQFNAFRSFVMTALAGLQQQLNLLVKQTDQLEMRSRRKMLLVHGISEDSGDQLAALVSSSLSSHLKLPDLQEDCFSRCQRLGRTKGEKPRPVLLKFRELSTRDQVWFAKTSLKNTGVTLSEFLTKSRHEAFMSARRKFSISKCYTREGVIIIIGQDGTRHRVTCKSEVDSIPLHKDCQDAAAILGASSVPKASKVVKPTVHLSERSRRNNKK